MRKNRLRLIQIVAMIVILGLAFFSPLLSLPPQQTANHDMNVPPPARVAAIDRPRPEIRVERVLKLDEFTGFDPDLAALLNGSRELRSGDDVATGGSARTFGQLASLSNEERGGAAR